MSSAAEADYSDESADYSSDEEVALFDALSDAVGDEDPEDIGLPRSWDVRAEIEWNGEIRTDLARVRNVFFGQSERLPAEQMRAVLAAVGRARELGGRRGVRYASYTATGWKDQLDKLLSFKSRRGEAELLARGVSRETLRRWKLGTQAPGKANQGLIAELYEWFARVPERRGGGDFRAACHEVANRVNEMFAEHTDGAQIRLRDIRRLGFY